MIARFSGASLGLLAFCVTILAGVYVQNPVTTTLSRGIFALFLFFMLGFALGLVADAVVHEHERIREDEANKSSPPRDADGADTPRSDRAAEDVGTPMHA